MNIIDLIIKEPIQKYNFAKTNWSKFQKCLLKKNAEMLKEAPLPFNRNMSNEEIDIKISEMTDIINQSIEKVVRKFKDKNSMDLYTSKTIRLLKRYKSSLVTRLNNIYRRFNYINNPEIMTIKSLLKNAQLLIKQQYIIANNNYGETGS